MIEYEFNTGSVMRVSLATLVGQKGYWLEISREHQAKRRSIELFRWLQNTASPATGTS